MEPITKPFTQGREGEWSTKPVAAHYDHADLVPLRRRRVLNAVVQNNIHELRTTRRANFRGNQKVLLLAEVSLESEKL